MRKCLECGSELDSDGAIISHTCEAYPSLEGFSWLDVVPQESGEK